MEAQGLCGSALRRRHVAEVSAIQDQFTALSQIGYLAEGIYQARPVPASHPGRNVAGSVALRRYAAPGPGTGVRCRQIGPAGRRHCPSIAVWYPRTTVLFQAALRES